MTNEELQKENEELKVKIELLRNKLRVAQNKLAAYESHAQRVYKQEQDYLPYEEDDRR